MDPILVIGNKNYSSWSLRPWLLLKVKAIAFERYMKTASGRAFANKRLR